MNTEASVYTRQSLDATREASAVAPQLVQCRGLRDQRGWTTIELFSNSDISATSGRTCPGLEAPLSSNPKRVILRHIDRLIRPSKDLERRHRLGGRESSGRGPRVAMAQRAVATSWWTAYQARPCSVTAAVLPLLTQG
jgi:hypothetical protein